MPQPNAKPGDAAIKGKTVYLRNPNHRDMKELLGLNQASTGLHRGLASPPLKPVEFTSFLKRSRQTDCACFLICRIEDSRIVGSINLSQIFLGGFRSALFYCGGPRFGMWFQINRLVDMNRQRSILESRLLSLLPTQLGFAILLTVLLSLPGCSKAGSSTTNLSAPQSDRPPDHRLEQQIKEIAADAKGHVGVAAVLLESGETIASLNSHDHFPMQSVYKLPISMAVMKQVDQGKLRLDQKARVTKEDYVPRLAYSPIRDKFPNGTELTMNELLRFALSESDGTASDVLMKLAGGPIPVQMYVTDLPVTDMIVLNTEKELAQDWEAQYRNSATPDSAVVLLRALHERRGLSESSQALLIKYMIESTPGAERLKGQLPPGTIVAHKTGTSGTNKGITAATNDIGLITLPGGKHLAIAVFVSDSPADAATREGVIAKIAKAVWDSAANH